MLRYFHVILQHTKYYIYRNNTIILLWEAIVARNDGEMSHVSFIRGDFSGPGGVSDLVSVSITCPLLTVTSLKRMYNL